MITTNVSALDVACRGAKQKGKTYAAAGEGEMQQQQQQQQDRNDERAEADQSGQQPPGSKPSTPRREVEAVSWKPRGAICAQRQKERQEQHLATYVLYLQKAVHVIGHLEDDVTHEGGVGLVGPLRRPEVEEAPHAACPAHTRTNRPDQNRTCRTRTEQHTREQDRKQRVSGEPFRLAVQGGGTGSRERAGEGRAQRKTSATAPGVGR